jgi:hypothetical protein
LVAALASLAGVIPENSRIVKQVNNCRVEFHGKKVAGLVIAIVTSDPRIKRFLFIGIPNEQSGCRVGDEPSAEIALE